MARGLLLIQFTNSCMFLVFGTLKLLMNALASQLFKNPYGKEMRKKLLFEGPDS